MSFNQLLDDIKLLDVAKSDSENSQVVNEVIRKAFNNEYHPSEIEIFLNTHKPENRHTKVIFVNLVRIIKHPGFVLKLLTSGDDELVKKTINNCTFFWNDKKYGPEFYINSVFTFMSYSNRMYLLNMLAKHLKDENRAEEYFLKFKNMYSLSAARPFLKYCRLSLLLELLKNRGIILNCSELLLILPDRPEVVLKYVRVLHEMKKNQEKYSCFVEGDFRKIFLKLMPNYLEEVVKFLEDFGNASCFPKLGKKNTRNVLRTNKNLFLKHPEYCLSYLHREIVFKCLTDEEYKIFYRNLFPKNEEQFKIEGNIEDYLKYYRRREKKLELLLDTYKAVYNKDLLENVMNLNPKIMELLSKEQRKVFAEKMISLYGKENRLQNPFFSLDDLTCYLPCDVAIPKFRQQIIICPDSLLRYNYLENMVKCCGYNEDLSALLEVLTYFNVKHRNELADARRRFLDVIVDHIDLKKLQAEHWKQMHELLDIMIMYKEIYRCNGKSVFPYSIEFNLKNNLPLEAVLNQYIVWSIKAYDANWNLFENYPEYEKQCLLTFGKLIPEALGTEGISHWLSFITAIKSWNDRHPDDLLSVVDFKWACDKIEKSLQSNNYDDFLYNYLKSDKRAAELFSERVKARISVSWYTLMEFVENDQEIIFRHISDLIKEALETHTLKYNVLPLIKTGKLRKIPRLEEATKNFCLELVKVKDENDDKNELKVNAIRLLSYWITPEEFFELTEEYFPKEGRASAGTNEANFEYEIQTVIAYSLKKFKDYQKIFEILRIFCVGDYLKLTVGFLNGICVKSVFRKSKDFLDNCLDSPVSFKKHVIRLQCLICSQNYVIGFLQELWKIEKNPSIREVIFKEVFELFLSEPNFETWSLLKSCIETVSFKDQHALKWVIDFRYVVNEFVSEYIVLIWNILMKLEKEEVDVRYHRQTVLIAFVEYLDLVPKEIIIKILQDNLFDGNINDWLQAHYTSLAVNFILQSLNSSDQENRIALVLDKMKKFFKSYWNENRENEDLLAKMNIINKFIDELCTTAISKQNKYKSTHLTLINFKDRLFEVFDPNLSVYKSFIIIQLSVLYIQNSCLKEFGKNIRQIIDDEVATNESYIIPYLAYILKSFFKQNNMAITEVVDGLLHLPVPLQSIECALVAINLLTPSQIRQNENESILKYLQTLNDRRITIYLNTP